MSDDRMGAKTSAGVMSTTTLEGKQSRRMPTARVSANSSRILSAANLEAAPPRMSAAFSPDTKLARIVSEEDRFEEGPPHPVSDPRSDTRRSRRMSRAPQREPSGKASSTRIEVKQSRRSSSARSVTKPSRRSSSARLDVKPSRRTSSARLEVKPSRRTSSARLEVKPSRRTSSARLEVKPSRRTSSARLEVKPSRRTSSARLEVKPSRRSSSARIVTKPSRIVSGSRPEAKASKKVSGSNSEVKPPRKISAGSHSEAKPRRKISGASQSSGKSSSSRLGRKQSRRSSIAQSGEKQNSKMSMAKSEAKPLETVEEFDYEPTRATSEDYFEVETLMSAQVVELPHQSTSEAVVAKPSVRSSVQAVYSGEVEAASLHSGGELALSESNDGTLTPKSFRSVSDANSESESVSRQSTGGFKLFTEPSPADSEDPVAVAGKTLHAASFTRIPKVEAMSQVSRKARERSGTRLGGRTSRSSTTVPHDWARRKSTGISDGASTFQRRMSSVCNREEWAGTLSTQAAGRQSGMKLARGPVQMLTGSVYDGDWDELGITGRGVYTMPHGVRYVGELQDGCFKHYGLLGYEEGASIKVQYTQERNMNGNDSTYRMARYGSYVFKDELKFAEYEWDYCAPVDRRFQIEVQEGLQPPCSEVKTQRQPTPVLPPGCYDTGDGVYNPKTWCVTSHDTGNVIRVPTRKERDWIMTHCRNSVNAAVGYRPDLYPGWDADLRTEQADTADRVAYGGDADDDGQH